MDQGWIELLAERSGELWLQILQHLFLTAISTVAGVVVGVPLGVLAWWVPWLRVPLLGAVGILQTVPSLAMLAFLLAVFQKIGTTPAVLALTLYALLPIVRNTLTGLEGVPAATREAARGIGMTPLQQLRLVELPLALPVIMAGIRTAAVVGVGVATLAAFIGAGGLGEFINRGLVMSNIRLVLLGAIPAAILAIVVDASIAISERAAVPWLHRGTSGRLPPAIRRLGLALPVVLAVAALSAYALRTPAPTGTGTVSIGTMNFTEQLILGELMARRIESAAGLRVERRFNLGATMITHQALLSGSIDAYPEYTGTALMAILERPAQPDAAAVLAEVRREYASRFACEWLDPFGFNNTYVLSARRADAAKNGWKRISDLKPQGARLVAGFVPEFVERADGWPGLRDTYKLAFREHRDMETSLMYQAIGAGEVDVVCNYSTDGKILVHDLVPLEDDLRFFPPYHAAPVFRSATLARYPAIRAALAPLAGLIDEGTMQRLNHEVDERKREPGEVAREFLAAKGL